MQLLCLTLGVPPPMCLSGGYVCVITKALFQMQTLSMVLEPSVLLKCRRFDSPRVCLHKCIFVADMCMSLAKQMQTLSRVLELSVLLKCRRYASPWVCLHKCIFVADMVLGKRSAATTHGFAARLVAMAEPAEEQEVQKYYVDPQNTAERYDYSSGQTCCSLWHVYTVLL